MDVETYIQYISQTMIRIEGEQSRGIGGRKARAVEYNDVGDHVECGVLFKGEPKTFFIDKDDLEKVQTRQWYVCVGGLYIGTHVNIAGKRKVLYLHNFIMNRLTFPGKGTTESVDHINRNGLDNRKSNLRVVSQSVQNTNQRAKARRAELPEGCGITLEELPKHVWYIKASEAHGDRFGIDIKTRNIKWKSSSSKALTLRQKLDETIRVLEEFTSSSVELA
jgi:hypothetical protein